MRKSVKGLLGLTLMMVPALACAQTTAPLTQRLDAIFDEAKWESAHWGVMVENLKTGQLLYQRNAAKSVMPASNMKLFTTAGALATLGADYRFETRLYATGTTDTLGTLHGNIYILGSGDPSISGRYLEDKPTTAILAEWVQAIRAMGIKQINGDIIGDDDIFDDEARAGSWSVDYLAEWYAAESSGLAINDNCWDLNMAMQDVNLPPGLRPDAPPLKRLSTWEPLDTRYFNVYTNVTTVPNDDEPTSAPAREEARLSIERVYNSNNIILKGTVEEDSAPLSEWGSIHNGTLFTVTLLKEALERAEGRSEPIKVTGKPVDIDDMDRQLAAHVKANPGTLVHTHVSPPLSKILAIINKPSQNFYADMLLKAIGAHAYGLGSWDNGQDVVGDLLTTAGVSSRTLNMADGSGLSRRDQVEPRQVLALLKYMHSRPDFAVFEASLPVMGIDGTLKGRMSGTAAEGNVKAKTGTIGGVRALSGYVTADNGDKLVFSMIANNFDAPTSEATEAQNQALLEIMKQ